jgi:hypothetical protein
VSEKISGEQNLFSAGFDLFVDSKGSGEATGPVTGEKSTVNTDHPFTCSEIGHPG